MKISVVLPVLAPTPFLRAMTEFSIKTLRAHASEDFELIICEAVYDWFDPEKWQTADMRIDRYFNFNPKIGGVREVNAGVDAAEGEFVLCTGTDVIPPPGWDRELLRVFEERPRDCGVAALSAYEPGAVIGPRGPQDRIVEGMFSPFMMFRRGWRFDEAYLRVYQDSDLVMRMYEQGLRAYRSCRASVWHFGSVTNNAVDTAEHDRALARDEELFYQRWGDSPLAMFAMMRWGQYTYGAEHESWERPIHRHT